MPQDKLLTIREVSQELGISEKEVIDFVQKGLIPAYKVGGVYLRFKRQQVEEAKKNVASKKEVSDKVSLIERLRDFLYFNDFYILALLIIIFMLIIIFRE